MTFLTASDDRPATVGVVNFGAGNIGNVQRALAKLDIKHETLASPGGIEGLRPTLLLLPGVGAFKPAMDRLISSGWRDALIDWVRSGRPLIGICLGMQLLCSSSSEDGQTAGLGLIEGDVLKLSGVKKIPHMGWNGIIPQGGEFPGNCLIHEGQNFYFVHSFAVSGSPHCAAKAEVDGVVFDSVLERENAAGFQFHPERSGPDGVSFLGRAISHMNAKYWSGRPRGC
ncbi:MAG: imidazole glycerol phosphate synthase subunit HisH [Synergistaceae bacterium]|nr:imidazole glycerol phosphate synthase subunit HisH [Synergistaceae bacterium]